MKRKNLPTALRRAVMERDGGCCTRCYDKERLHIHHILPLCEGGADDIDNLTLLCHACHILVHEERGDVEAVRMLQGEIGTWKRKVAKKRVIGQKLDIFRRGLKRVDVSKWRVVYELTDDEAAIMAALIAMGEPGSLFVRDVYGGRSPTLVDVGMVLRDDYWRLRSALESLDLKRVVYVLPCSKPDADISERAIIFNELFTGDSAA